MDGEEHAVDESKDQLSFAFNLMHIHDEVLCFLKSRVDCSLLRDNKSGKSLHDIQHFNCDSSKVLCVKKITALMIGCLESALMDGDKQKRKYNSLITLVEQCWPVDLKAECLSLIEEKKHMLEEEDRCFKEQMEKERLLYVEMIKKEEEDKKKENVKMVCLGVANKESHQGGEVSEGEDECEDDEGYFILDQGVKCILKKARAVIDRKEVGLMRGVLDELNKFDNVDADCCWLMQLKMTKIELLDVLLSDFFKKIVDHGSWLQFYIDTLHDKGLVRSISKESIVTLIKEAMKVVRQGASAEGEYYDLYKTIEGLNGLLAFDDSRSTILVLPGSEVLCAFNVICKIKKMDGLIKGLGNQSKELLGVRRDLLREVSCRLQFKSPYQKTDVISELRECIEDAEKLVESLPSVPSDMDLFQWPQLDGGFLLESSPNLDGA